MKLKDLMKDKATKAKLSKLGIALATKITPQQVNTMITVLRALGIVETQKGSKRI